MQQFLVFSGIIFWVWIFLGFKLWEAPYKLVVALHASWSLVGFRLRLLKAEGDKRFPWPHQIFVSFLVHTYQLYGDVGNIKFKFPNGYWGSPTDNYINMSRIQEKKDGTGTTK
jgi:hypothetical protein